MSLPEEAGALLPFMAAFTINTPQGSSGGYGALERTLKPDKNTGPGDWRSPGQRNAGERGYTKHT